MNKIRVLLADDHAVLRAGLKVLLSSEPDIEICGEAESGAQAVARSLELRPDVVVMDLRMSGTELDGIEATRTISATPGAPRVLVLSMYDDPTFMDQALAAGAAGYARKRDADTDLLSAIRAVARGEAYLAPALTTVMLRRISEPNSDEGGPERDLSTREVEVLRQLALGYNHRQIAETLGLSVKTVETYKARVMDKLGVHGRAALVRYALAHGLLADQV
jgi:DNA-binding NarL/FixJ family response regulator